MKSKRFRGCKQNQKKLKFLWAILLTLGVLPFVFSQSSYEEGRNDLKAFSKKSDEFKNGLLDLRKKHKNYLEKNCNILSELYRDLGSYYFLNQESETSLRYYRDSADLSSRFCEPIDYNLRARISLNLEGIFTRLSMNRERSNIIDSMVVLIQKNLIPDEIQKGKVITRIGRYFRELNDSDKALIWVRKSIALYNKLPLANEAPLRAYSELANIYFEIDPEKAMPVYDTLVDLADKLGLYKDHNHYLNAYSNLSALHYDQNNFKEAKRFNELALKISKARNLNDSYAYQLNVKSQILNATDEKSESLKLLNEAINVAERSNTRLANEYLVYFLDSLGRHYLRMDSMSQVKHAAINILEISSTYDSAYGESWMDDQIIITNKESFLKGAILELSAETPMTIDNWQFYKSKALTIDSIFQSRFSELSGDASKIILAAQYHTFCSLVLETLFNSEQESTDVNFTAYFMANSKSILTRQSLTEINALEAGDRESFYTFQNQKNGILSQIQEAIELDERDILDRLSSEYFELMLAAREILDKDQNVSAYKDFVSSIQKELNDKDLLLEYFSSAGNIYQMAIRKSSINFSQKVLSTGERAMLSTFNDSLRQGKLMENQIQKTSSILLGKIPKGWIESCDRLIIVPENEIQKIPFDILLHNESMLIDQKDIIFQFSSFDLISGQKQNSGSLKKFAGFGSSYSNELLSKVKNDTKIKRLFGRSFNLLTIEESENELNESAILDQNQIYYDEECSVENFEKFAETADLLHITNHVLLNENNSYLTSILFNSQDDDYQLYDVLDIRKLNLKAKLSILSSCNSGTGQNFFGNGMRSIGQAFFDAGCPSLAINLWESSDYSSSLIIKNFISHLKSGMTKSAAMRAAKLEYIDKVIPSQQDPLYWANLIIVGSDEVLQFKKRGNFPLYAAIVLLLVVSILFITNKRRPSKMAS